MRRLVTMPSGCRPSLAGRDLLLASLFMWARCGCLGDQLRTVVSGFAMTQGGWGSCGAGIPDLAFARSRIHRISSLPTGPYWLATTESKLMTIKP